MIPHGTPKRRTRQDANGAERLWPPAPKAEPTKAHGFHMNNMRNKKKPTFKDGEPDPLEMIEPFNSKRDGERKRELLKEKTKAFIQGDQEMAKAEKENSASISSEDGGEVAEAASDAAESSASLEDKVETSESASASVNEEAKESSEAESVTEEAKTEESGESKEEPSSQENASTSDDGEPKQDEPSQESGKGSEESSDVQANSEESGEDSASQKPAPEPAKKEEEEIPPILNDEDEGATIIDDGENKPKSADVVLTCKNLCKTYSDGTINVEVIKNLNFEVKEGQSVCIYGASGSGKSSFLHLLGGLDTPTSGNVELMGEDLGKASQKKLGELRNKYLGFVYQFHHLLQEFSALENVMMPLLVYGYDEDQSAETATRMLESVGLKNRIHHRPNELSGGERQRVSIARALVNHPKCVLADEPTGNLDKKNAKQALSIMIELQKRLGTAIVVVTHDEDLAKHFDMVYLMDEGNLHVHPIMKEREANLANPSNEEESSGANNESQDIESKDVEDSNKDGESPKESATASSEE